MFSINQFPESGSGGGITLSYLQTNYVQQADLTTALTPLALKSYVDSQDATKATQMDLDSNVTSLTNILNTKASVAQLPDLTPYAFTTQLTPLALTSYVDTQLGTKANQTDLITLSGTVSTNTANIATNTTNIAANTTALAAKADASTVTAKADKTYVDTQLGTKANQTDLTTLSGTVSTNTANIATNTTNIAANTTAVSGFTGQIAYHATLLNAVTTRTTKPFVWLRARDLLGVVANGGTVSTWNPPPGTTGLVTGTGRVIGTGTLPLFYNATNEPMANYMMHYVRFSGTQANRGVIDISAGPITLHTYSKGLAWIMVYRVQTAVNGSPLLWGQCQANTSYACQFVMSTATSSLGFALPLQTGATTFQGYAPGIVSNSATSNVWSIIGMRSSASNQNVTFLQWSTNGTAPRTDKRTYKYSATVTQDTVYNSLGIMHNTSGAGSTTYSFDIGELILFDDDVTDDEFMGLWDRMKAQYGLYT